MQLAAATAAVLRKSDACVGKRRHPLRCRVGCHLLPRGESLEPLHRPGRQTRAEPRLSLDSPQAVNKIINSDPALRNASSRITLLVFEAVVPWGELGRGGIMSDLWPPEEQRGHLDHDRVDDAGAAIDRAYASLGLELLLFAVQSPINIGMIMRVAEAYCFTVSIFDPYHVLQDREKFKTIEDFACGSLPRRNFVLLEDEAALALHRAGRRLIVTSIFPSVSSLPMVRFQAGDIIAFGNEYDGVPDKLVGEADLKFHIPMPETWIPKPLSWYPIDPTRGSVLHDGTPNLNVAISAGIVCYSAYTSWKLQEP